MQVVFRAGCLVDCKRIGTMFGVFNFAFKVYIFQVRRHFVIIRPS